MRSLPQVERRVQLSVNKANTLGPTDGQTDGRALRGYRRCR